MFLGKRILVAPLNWGLGHATRCLPIVRALQAQGAEVLLASDGRAGQLLQQELPELPYFELPAYAIQYSGQNMLWTMLRQMPRLGIAVMREYFALQKLIRSQKIDAVISDNRLGCFSSKVPCVFITHQLHIRAPQAWAAWLINRAHRFFIKRFQDCWVPDYATPPRLAGQLSAPIKGIQIRYLRPLSRFKTMATPPRYDLIAVLSGPEPQRSHFEAIVREQLLAGPWRSLLVRGCPEQSDRVELSERVTCVDFLGAEALNEAMAASRVVLSRSGYSTMMDLAVLAQPAILVPTPEQSEQEYLAEQASGNPNFSTFEQSKLDIAAGMQALEQKAESLDHRKTDTFSLMQALASLFITP